MDSKLTLVNPSALRLDFSKDSMKDAVLSSNGRPVYVVSSPGKSGSRTEIRDAETQRLLVTIKRRSLFSDIVTFADHYGGNSVKLDKWMIKTRLMDGSEVTVVDTGVGRYHWKTHVVNRFALYSEHNVQDPLAYMIITGTKPSVVLEAGTESFRDQILASLLVLEQNLRMEEKWSSIADGMNADNRTVFGHQIKP